MIPDSTIIEDLRAKVRNGDSAVNVMRDLIDRLQLGPQSRLVVIVYFQTAFDMQLQDASKLGAWNFFTGATWPEEVINEEITPILRRYSGIA